MPKTLVELLRENAKRSPQKTCLYFYNHKINYQSLAEQSRSLSIELLKLGLKRRRVAILLLNSPEFIVSYFGIIQTGSAAVPINTMFKEEEAEYIVRDSGCSAIITSAIFLNIVRPLKEKCPDLKYIILTDGALAGALNFRQIIEKRSCQQPDVALSEEDVASILYTSGTTGHPKGALLTHRNFLSNVSSCVAVVEVSPEDNVICLLPMFHSFAWTVCVLMPLSCGASLTIVDSLKPFRKLVRNIIAKKVTIFVGIPSLYHIFSEMHIPQEFMQRILKMIGSLRLCISGAAALPAEVLEKFQEKFQTPLLEGYGLTEAAPVVSLNPLKGAQKPGSVGLPIKEVQIKVVDEQGNNCPTSVPGELVVKGPNVMQGYLNHPEATQEAIREGWLYTGDIARIDPDGYIYIVDRKKDMINVRGLNVYPKEVENILMLHPKIKEVAVVRAWDKNKGEIPKAFVMLKDKNQPVTTQELIRFCRSHLAEFKIPKNIEFIESLPKNALGKVLKRELERV